MLIFVLRLVLVGHALVGFLVGGTPVPAAPERARHRFNLVRATRWCRRGLRMLGIRARVIDAPATTAPRLQVANHLSYLDAIVLCAVRPCLFVTSQEVADDPLLGRIAKTGGCEFVDRRSLRNLVPECRRLAGHLDHVSLLFFPEATSTDGSHLRRFKTAFFTIASEGRLNLQPVAIRYPRVGGRPFSPATRDLVCWYGDMTFAPHLLRLLSVPRIEAEVRFLPRIPPEGDRKQLAERAQAVLAAELGLPVA